MTNIRARSERLGLSGDMIREAAGNGFATYDAVAFPLSPMTFGRGRDAGLYRGQAAANALVFHPGFERQRTPCISWAAMNPLISSSVQSAADKSTIISAASLIWVFVIWALGKI